MQLTPGVTTFLGLLDAPSSYTASYLVRVNAGGTGLEFVAGSGLFQPLDATLTALAAYSTNGLLTQTAADTFAGRTITGTSNQVVVANGDGVSGNPTLSLPQSIHTAATPTFAALTLSGNLTSTLATGTAPFVIASTTKVANLNADLLDDQSGAYYLDSTNFTGTNWTDLTDGGATTLHTHATIAAVTVANEATDTSCFVGFFTAATGDLGPKTNANLAYNSNTGVWTAAHAWSVAGNNITLTSTENTADACVAILQGDHAAPQILDAAYVSMRLSDEAGTQVEVGKLIWYAADITAGSVDGLWGFAHTINGTPTVSLLLGRVGSVSVLAPNSNDLLALGTATSSFADLYLASGAVINWANGEVTITESDANTLTVAGATLITAGTSCAVACGTVELGHASDTTLSRSSAGVLAVEGKSVFLTLGTEQATTSGTSVTFSSIPSGVTEVTVNIIGFSTSATSGVRIRIGPSGGVETTGYSIGRSYMSVGGAGNANSSTTGIDFFNASTAARISTGRVTLKLEDSSDNTWTVEGGLHTDDTTDYVEILVGSKSLAGVLSVLEFTTQAGNTFDAGAVNISWRF